MKQFRQRFLLLGIALVLLAPQAAFAATLTSARSAAIGWLESHQNSDGSWGSGSTRALATAEVLLALAEAERANGGAANRAKGWLLNHEYANVDYQARALRALGRAGVDASARAQRLVALVGPAPGWGPTSGQGATSYDSALALAGVRAAGGSTPGEITLVAAILDRRRGDTGWSGDDVPVGTDAPSDRTLTAEIVRALREVGDLPGLMTQLLATYNFLSTAGGPVDAGTPTLEVASRLAALHALGGTDPALEAELLSEARMTTSTWSDDPFVNAIGLLAVDTKPNAAFPPACPDDSDCDGILDDEDAFPYDGDEQHDTDADGVGDAADDDIDGDGVKNADDAFPNDPTEVADSDGDGIGDSQEVDADNDGMLDADELELGLDPTQDDTDGDGVLDGADDCPLIAGGVDNDGDGVCPPFDECDDQPDPNDLFDLDGDGICDLADTDDDDDGISDADEIAAGSDPRDADSAPPTLVADEDFDSDGLTNVEEDAWGTSAYQPDSDGDGAIDGFETAIGTNPLLAADQPEPVIEALSGITPAPAVASEEPGGAVETTATGAQSTPTGGAPAEGGDLVNLPGFQPQLLARDVDGDGLDGFAEGSQGTSLAKVDTDDDGFADGPGGVVANADYEPGWDVDGDGFVDGEQDAGTDPTDPDEHVGKAGDVAPLGAPDGRIDVGDAAVELRIVADPNVAANLGGDAATVTQNAADVDGDASVNAADGVQLLRQVADQ